MDVVAAIYVIRNFNSVYRSFLYININLFLLLLFLIIIVLF